MRERDSSFPLVGIYLLQKQLSLSGKLLSFYGLYYFQIHLRHLLASFPFWRPLIPLSVALLRCVSFTLARMKNSRRILAHSYLEIV